MKASKPSPQHREGWIKDQVDDGIDVLICHPKLVQTGLDLIDFPTICWFQTEYSTYTTRQASRRSWRIGQHQEVKVVYLAYLETLQGKALSLVAHKMQSSLAMEGEIPREGLSSYHKSENIMLQLAQEIVARSTEEVECR